MNQFRETIENSIDRDQLNRLRLAAGHGPLLILTHANPDPDSLASGVALATLFEKAWSISARLLYTGLVERAENKAMLRLLTPEWEFAENLPDLAQFSAIALLDTQPGAGNNNLPAGVNPQIVIDHHHPLRDGLQQVQFVDVRPVMGATVSMVYQYLVAAGIIVDGRLATAIFYGIQADTLGLSRGGSRTDQEIYFSLFNRIDRQTLVKIEQAGLSRDYYRAFARGLQAARLYGASVVADLGTVHRPDFVGEIADLLGRLEVAQAVLCIGIHEGKLHLSLRTRSNEKDAGVLIQDIILPPGKAGGHGRGAGGQILLGTEDIDVLIRSIVDRFLNLMGETEAGEPLLGE